MEVTQDLLELFQALFGLVSEEALANFVPVLLRDLAFETAFLHLVQPCVYWGILLRITKETWWVLPGVEDGVEVKFLYFECIEHGGIEDKRAVYGKYRIVVGIDVVRFSPLILRVLKYTSGMPHGNGVKPSHKRHSLGPDQRVCLFGENLGSGRTFSHRSGGEGGVQYAGPPTRVLFTFVGKQDWPPVALPLTRIFTWCLPSVDGGP